jgi:ABC-2 type transport system permease protein
VRGALVYLTVCSVRNRVIRRVRRLKEPRYLAGAVAGSLYIYFAFLRSQLRAMKGTPNMAAATLDRFSAWAGSLGALALWLFVVLRWALPSVRPPLQFSGPEVQFLFTAPLPRRRLLHYKLLRGQFGLLFTSLVALLLGGRAAPSRLSFVLGLFLLLSTLRLHMMGVVLSRASLTQPGGRRRPGAWLPLGLTVGASVAIVLGLGVGLVPLISRATLEVIGAEVLRQTSTGVVGAALWPARILVRPIVSEWPWAFLRALGPALLVLVLNYAWVLASDARLEDAAIASERRRSEGRSRPPVVAARRAPFRLSAAGRPEIAILWKNVLMIGRQLSVRNIIRFALPLIGVAAGMAATGNRHSGGLTTAALVCLTGAAVAALMGPQMMRNDLRTDLAHLPILKTWPLAGEAIIRGELLAPTLLLSGFAWLCVVLALLLSIGIPIPTLSLLDRLALAVTAVIAIPGVVAAQLVIHNGAAVLFPGWIVTGTSRPRGIEAFGQQMLMFAGTVLLLGAGLLPAAVAAVVVGFPLRWLVGWSGLIPAAGVFVMVLLVESWLATAALGRVLDRTDPSAVEVNE